MTFLDSVLRAFGFRNLIHVSGRSFENLTDEQVALMIESSIFATNDLFDYAALHEFRLIPNDNPHLEQVRQRILEIESASSSPASPDGLRTDAGRAALRDFIVQLRRQDSGDSALNS